MSYRFDQYDGALVIEGWENGIAKSPYEGISDARNILLTSVPGEVSVGFSTGSLSAVISAGTVTSTLGSNAVFVGASGLESYMAISFGTTGGMSGITAGTTVYWIGSTAGGSFPLYSDYATQTQVNITGSGAASFTVYAPDFSVYKGNQPNKFTRSTQSGNTFLQDSKGRVWSNKHLTASNRWTFIGNQINNNGDASSGNGIVYLQPNGSGAGYIFIFNDSSIDYFQDNSANTIHYGWSPTAGTNNNAAGYLNAGSASGASHDALLGQDNTIYYCDASFVGSLFEKVGQTFDPTNTATYTFAKQALSLPKIDFANCLTELGTSLLVGGTRNLIYPWDRISTSFNYPIFLSESVVQRMVTVNTNAFIFVGNRGRIHITNGSQAQEWIKIPDHLSGTVEPYYVWGGATFNKNQLYFSVAGINNDGTANTNYGAIWAIDTVTKALRVVNQMSYASYAGLAPALYAITPLAVNLVGNPPGAGLIMGWCSGSVINSGQSPSFSGGSSGIDTTISTPFLNSQAYIDSDLIPIGTFNIPRNFNQIEYLLTKPLVSGESIKVQYRTDFSQSFTDIFTDSTVGNFTNGYPNDFSNVK